MAITAADLQVKLSTTGADAVKRDLQGVDKAVDATGQKSSRMGSTIATAFRWGVIGAATGAIAGGTAAIGSFIMGASNLAEAQSKVNVVFGESAGQVNTWSKAAADAFGITEADALSVTGTMGNLFTNMGFTKDAAAGMSTEIVGLSADMSSFFNVSQPQVIEALTSAFVGEYDALQRLGVPISAAAVEQYALNNGIWDGVDAMTDAERTTAVYGLTIQSTSNAQGDFARTSGDLANKTRILKANFANLGASIGKVLIPAAITLTGWGIDTIDWLSEMGNPLDAIADKFSFLGDIFGPLLDTFDHFSTSFRAMTADVKAFNLWGGEVGTVVEGMSVIPAFFIALGNTIAGLGGGIPIIEDIGEALMDAGVHINTFTDSFQRARDQGLNPFQASMLALYDTFPAFQGAFDQIYGIFQKFQVGDFGGAFRDIGTGIMDALGALGGFAASLGSWTLDVGVPTVTGWIVTAAGNVWDALKTAAGWAWDGLVAIGAWTLDVAVPAITGWVADNAGGVWDAIKSAAGWVWDGLQDLGAWTLSVPVPAITGWVADNLWPAIKAAAGWVWDGLQSLGAWTLTIPLPTLEGLADIGSSISDFAQEAWDAVRGAPISLDGALMLSIGDFDVELPGLYDSINQAFYDAADLNEGQLAGVNAAGEQVGRSAMTAFLGGLRAAFTGGGGAGGFTDIASGQVFGPAIRAFLSGMFEGMGDVVNEEITPRLQELSDSMSETLQGWADSITGLFTDLSIPDITIPAFTITWPEWPSLDSIPFVSQFIALLGNMRSLFGGLSWSFTIPLPTITWPTVPGIGDVPFVSDFISLIADIAKTVSGQIWSISIPIPTITWPDVSSITGSIPQWMKDFVSMSPLDFVKKYMPGGGGDEAAANPTTTANSAGSGGGGWGLEMPFGNMDFSGIIGQLGEVRDAAGEAGAAVASIFGGGMGAVGGVGAGGAADASGLLGSLASVQTALTGLTTLAATASAAMGAVIAAIANGMTTAQTVLASSVAGMASAMTAGMAIVRSAAASGMAGVIVAVANGMATARSVTAAGAAGMAASMVAGMAVFRAAVTSGMAAAVGAVRSGISAMVAAASAGRGMMMSAGLGIGAALGQGIAAGIQSMVGAVAAAAAALVSAAIGAARSAGAISSPSRVMQEQVGQMLGLGAALGVEDMYPRMDRAMAGLIRTPTVPYSAGNGLGQSVGSNGGNNSRGGDTFILEINAPIYGVDDLRTEFRNFAIAMRDDGQRHKTAVLGGAQ